MKDIPFPEYRYFDTAIGGANCRNRVKRIDELLRPENTVEVYVTMFRFREDYYRHCQMTGSVKGVSHLTCYGDYVWFDIDSDDLQLALENARQLVRNIDRIDPDLLNHLVIFFSGAKGFHIGIPASLFGASPLVELPKVFKRLAQQIASGVPVDFTIYEKNRLWRVPNTRNKKSELFKISLTSTQLASWSIEKVKELAREPLGKPFVCPALTCISEPSERMADLYSAALADLRSPTKSQETRLVRPSRELICDILAGLSEGNCNNSFTRITGRLHRLGVKRDEIFALLELHAMANDFTLDELRRVVSGICQRYPRHNSDSLFPTKYSRERETEKKLLEVLPLSEFLAKANQQISWCVDRLIPKEAVCILAGPPGQGKSWMLLDLAAECARGGKWLGYFQTAQTPVLYIDEESSPVLLRHRLNKLLAAKELDIGRLDVHLSVGQGLCLTDEDSIDALHEHISQLNPGLVIIDSLIRVHRAEENSASEMSRMFAVVKEIVREHGCSVIFADHQRKPGLYKTSLDQRLRGSSEKAAFIDTLLSLQRKDVKLIVEHSKSRFAEPVAAFVVSIEDRRPDTTTVAYQGEAEAIRRAARQKTVREFLENTLSNKGWISGQDLFAQAQGKGLSRKVLAESLKTLLKESRIERDDRKPENGRGGKAAFYQWKPRPA